MNVPIPRTVARVLLTTLLFIPTARAIQDKEMPLVLAEGTPVKVVTATEISSKTAKAGDSVTFKLDEEICLAGQAVIAKGTIVSGSVITAEPAGRLGNSGKLGVVVQWTTTFDGQRLKLRAAKGEEGDDKTVSTSFLTGLNPLFLLRKGGDARIPEGTQITVYVAETKYFRLDSSTLVASNPPASDGDATEPPKTPTKERLATVFIYRPEKWFGYMQEPSVFVDDTELARMDNGRYFALKLPAGQHMVHMTDKKRSFVIDMGAGETYYFRIAIESSLTKQHGKLTLEDAETGRKEIKKLKFIGRDKIKAPQLVAELSPQ